MRGSLDQTKCREPGALSFEFFGWCLLGNAWLPATEPFKTSQSKGGVEVEVINGVKRIGCVATGFDMPIWRACWRGISMFISIVDKSLHRIRRRRWTLFMSARWSPVQVVGDWHGDGFDITIWGTVVMSKCIFTVGVVDKRLHGIRRRRWMLFASAWWFPVQVVGDWRGDGADGFDVSLKGWFRGMLRVIVVVLGFGRQLTNARKPLFDGGCHFGDVLTVTDFGIWHYIAAMAVGVQFL